MIFEQLSNKISNINISCTPFHVNIVFGEEGDRRILAYNDPKFLLFYYYLGKLVKPKVVLEYGLTIGLIANTFFKSCKTVDKFIGLHKKDFFPNVAKRNIKNNYQGVIEVRDDLPQDDNFDLVMITDEFNYLEYRDFMDFIWGYLKDGGLIVIDYINVNSHAYRVYNDFCKIKNREFLKINTRYGVGLIHK